MFVTKKKLESIHYDLGNIVRNDPLSDWPQKVRSIYDKHFPENAEKLAKQK